LYIVSFIIFEFCFSSNKFGRPNILYNATCVYSLNNDTNKAIQYLSELTDVYFYSDIEHISTDTDLDNLHNLSVWKNILEKTKQNKSTLPQRRRNKIQNELLKAKYLLDKDNGKLWNGSLWSDYVLVLDDDNVVYTLNSQLSNAQKDGLLYYKTIEPNTLQHTNTNQDFEGKKWAIVQNSYVTAADSCQTIIHELFHLFHLKQMNLSGNIVEHLDDHKARILLRTEFEALRNCLHAIQKKNDIDAKQFLSDAMFFRTEREKKFKKVNHFALELETLEGLASYTGYKLSAHSNLYQIAIEELYGRDQPTGLNRSFAYATGLAYGLVFDYFNMEWRSDLNHIYSFSDIYKKHNHSKNLYKSKIDTIKKRNRYNDILKEELSRKATTDSITKIYTKQFLEQSVLSVRRDTSDKTYLMSYDMNSTFSFGKSGIVYANISSASTNPNVFGNFTTTGETGVGKSGILITSNFDKITFTKPIKIEGNIITGEYYKIELNKDWKVITIDKKGNMEIVRK